MAEPFLDCRVDGLIAGEVISQAGEQVGEDQKLVFAEDGEPLGVVAACGGHVETLFELVHLLGLGEDLADVERVFADGHRDLRSELGFRGGWTGRRFDHGGEPCGWVIIQPQL